MNEKLENTEPPTISGYVGNIKDGIKRKFSKYKMSKIREHYRDALELEEKAEYKKAIQKYKACLEVEPENTKCLKRLANLYSNLEENTLALENYFKLTKLNPNEETFFQLSQEYFRQNRFRKTIQYLKKSLYYNKRFINAHILLATVYIKADNHDKTEQYLRNALKIDPNNKNSLEELMKLYYRQGRYRDSLEFMNHYSSLYGEDLSLKLLKIDLHSKMGSNAKALRLLFQVASDDTKFKNFTDELQLKKSNPTAREKEFINRVTDRKNQKIVSFKNNLQSYYKDIEGFSLNPKDAFDLSILYLLIGKHKKALKYLLFARQLNEEKKYL